MGIYALTQKYRPLIFKDILDQEGIIRVLKGLLKANKFSMPFMFGGCFGTGKTSLARIFGRAILCEHLTPDIEPCNECTSCRTFLEGSNPAYTEIDAASNGGVEDIRKLRNDANFRVLGGYKNRVLVIDECHSISRMGNEALLKQLEDNIDNQIYIFCTTAPENMNEAVRSRCFEFNLNQISKESIFNRLKLVCQKENILYTENSLKTIASIDAPHVRDALKHLDYLSNFGEITDSVVSNYFNLSTQIEYLKILLHLKDNFLEMSNILYNLILKRSIPDIYKGLVETLIKIYKLNFGVDTFNNPEELNLGKQLQNYYGEEISKILDDILNYTHSADALNLEADLMILHKKLNGCCIQFKEMPIIALPKIENKQINKKEEPENIEKTSAILNRYKSYSESLAMMMERSKNSNSVNSLSTVELKKTKDFKSNLSKKDIKTFINSKRSTS